LWPHGPQAKRDAETLKRAGENKWGTDEAEFIMLFCKRSMPQLKLTFDEYVKQSKYSNMVDVVEAEFSSDIRRALKALVEVATDKCTPAPFAPWRIACIRSAVFTRAAELVLLTAARRRCTRARCAYFAKRLMKSMKGLGTDDTTLVRIVVARADVDMGAIKQRFHAAYGKSLGEWIADDTSGNYEKLLLRLVGGTTTF